jgi:hypothetical protein
MNWQKLGGISRTWRTLYWTNNVKSGDGMIKITDDAMQILKAILVGAEAEPDGGLRLLPTPDGKFALVLDTELSGEQVVAV